MRIAFYMPFKPLGHPNPSGDLVIGSELFDFFKEQGHNILLISRLRSRWIYWKPWRFLGVPLHGALAVKKARQFGAQLWLTYHSYYKAPDLLGPVCSQKLNIPYAIFQGIYATKYRRRLKTLPGFWLNRRALLAADLVLSNKHKDYHNLKRIIPPNKLLHISPGIRTARFSPCLKSRNALRQAWGIVNFPVIITTAMFRSGVKTEGLKKVINSCGMLLRDGIDFFLVIVGDGENRRELEQLARLKLPRRYIFLGRIAREQLYQYFSAADIFAFPGIEESLGMVYLEAQVCELPVVAMGYWGAKEAVVHKQTGILVNDHSNEAYADAIKVLLNNPSLRQTMGQTARQHILTNHDLFTNYRMVLSFLTQLVYG